MQVPGGIGKGLAYSCMQPMFMQRSPQRHRNDVMSPDALLQMRVGLTCTHDMTILGGTAARTYTRNHRAREELRLIREDAKK